MAGLDDTEKIFSFGMIGGITNVLQGGKFGNGFAVAGFSWYVGRGVSDALRPALGKDSEFVAFVMTGGTMSGLTGNKFANGAAMAAFTAAVEAIGDEINQGFLSIKRHRKMP